MNELFINFKSDIITKLEKLNTSLIETKDINYGQQLNFISDNLKIKITLYYNKKNKFNYVINNVIPKNYYNDVLAILTGENNSITEEKEKTKGIIHSWNYWAGSDESGKGDYFGPLVICAFTCESKNLIKLHNYGVKDSKLLNDDKIKVIAEKVLLDFRGSYQYLILMPEKYNELYSRFSVNKPGLNELLAWSHSRVIGDLYLRHKFEGVIIDKFANENLIKYYVNKTCPLNLKIITKAESDINVATASIISRYLYIKKLDELSEIYNITLLKGASLKVKKLKKSINPEIMPYIAKLHFKD